MEISLPERLDDGVIALRPMRPDDAGPYAAAFREDPDLGRLLGMETDPDEASVRARLEAEDVAAEDRGFVQFAIAAKASDTFCGEVLVHSISERNRRGEIGFWVAPEARGRGIASRAIALALDWLFGDLELLRVEMTTTPDNGAVPALARRLGFTREGLLRARNVERGQRVDLVWFGLLREEWLGG